MKQFKTLFISSLIIVLYFLLSVSLLSAQTIYFDDQSKIDIIILGNNFYEIGLRKTNGSISYIIDKKTGQNITPGSRYEQLWGVNLLGGLYIGSRNSPFSYTWLSDNKVLTLNYMLNSNSTPPLKAVVTIFPAEDRYFDLQLQIANPWGITINKILFPSDLVFLESDINTAILPILPGVELKAAFFNQHRSFTTPYPGNGGFADYVSISLKTGNIAIYTLYDKKHFKPLDFGFIHDDEYIRNTTFFTHTYPTFILKGENWTSPKVRIRIGQSTLETIADFRNDNGVGQFPSLAQKLDSLYDRVIKSPLIKGDADHLGIPFAMYQEFLCKLPSPSLFHPVAFQNSGHDHNYPDFIPPDPKWGTTSAFRDMFNTAHSFGLLVMPYINPTWWNEGSPTLQNLPPPLTIPDLTVIGWDGKPCYENYGSNGGYVMCPYHLFVQKRLNSLFDQITIEVPGDLIFEDQIGARPWLYDLNPVSPHPTSYIQGWIEHTKSYKNKRLMTEQGFDRLIETEIGFHGSIILDKRFGTQDMGSGGFFRPFPFAPLLAHDKVLFYQHDLDPAVMTNKKATLIWNLAFGYMLSYDLGLKYAGLNDSWIDIVGDFQHRVISRYVSEMMEDFIYEKDQISRTNFKTISILVNWHKNSTYIDRNHTLAPEGALITSNDGNLTAGIFTVYNNKPLSSGDHYLIEEREPTCIVVRHPSGEATKLTITPYPTWIKEEQIKVQAFNSKDSMICTLPFNLSADSITFTYPKNESGNRIAYVRIPTVTKPPVLSKLPDISFPEDDSLTIELSDWYDKVHDPDTPDSVLVWSIENGKKVICTNHGDSLTFKSALHNWFGSDTLLVIVSDGKNCDSSLLAIHVLPINDPPIIFPQFPDTIMRNIDTLRLNLNDFVDDPDDPDSNLTWSAMSSKESFVILIDKDNIANLIALTKERNEINVIFCVRDSRFAEARDTLLVVTTDVIESKLSIIPKEFSLSQNYPNPFNPKTIIKYGIPKTCEVTLDIYNVLGNKVATLVETRQPAGMYEVTWDAAGFASGIYLFRLHTEQYVKMRKMMLLK